MERHLTPRSSLATLRREAKRWLAALRAGDPDARARLDRALPDHQGDVTLRAVQRALARELGFAGWAALRAALAARAVSPPDETRDAAVQRLLAAAERGDADAVRAVLGAWPDVVNERAVLAGHTGRRTALHFAMNRDSEAVVDVLLERGADPNVRDDGDAAYPLHFAAEHRALGIVRRLVEHGADPIGDGDGHELGVIGWATCFGPPGDFGVATYLLAHGARHTIYSAVAMGDAAAVRDILARDPAERERPMDATNRRRRPLHLAVVQRQRASLDELLAYGADVEAVDAAGLTALDQAALDGARDLATRLIEHGARVGLPAAVALGRTADVDRLLAEDPASLRPGGRWARLIVRAAEHAPGDVIERLVRAGASVHVRDDYHTAVDGTHGYTALHAAAFHGNLSAVRVLLRHGADPAAREDRWWGTPAGWAAYAHHDTVRDVILDGAIDVFDAIAHDRRTQLGEILDRDPRALERPFGRYVTGDHTPRSWLDPAWTPIAYAAVYGTAETVRALLARGADLAVRDAAGRTPADLAAAHGRADVAAALGEAVTRPRAPSGSHDRVADFLEWACLDWRTGGGQRVMRMHDADRLVRRHPELARSNLYTAVVCGELEEVRRLVGERPELASAIGGPRSRPPLPYLAAARLSTLAAAGTAVAIARLLLDAGADPNAFYLGGNADIHYTVLTCVLGRGEEQAAMHPAAHELTELLLERGADPFDGQVLYNVFADHASRRWLGDDLVWLLDAMYRHSQRRGRAADWRDPTWPMFALFGAPSLGDEGRRQHGAHFMLEAAVDRNLLGLTEWMLAHGAGPDTPPGTAGAQRSTRTLYQEAMARGHDDMARLLARYGAVTARPAAEGIDAFVEAALRLDRARVAALLGAHPEYREDSRALFAAVAEDRADVVAMLLDAGVSPDVEDVDGGGGRALHLAAYVGAERSAALLLARGAAVDARDERHHAIPLGVASWAQQPRMVELLGRSSRDVWELTHAGCVDRLRAVLGDDPGAARAVGAAGDTPLMWLPDDEERALAVARVLLAAGADPARRDREGRTAREIATGRGLDAVVELLRASGG